jgi:hypothetical protein
MHFRREAVAFADTLLPPIISGARPWIVQRCAQLYCPDADRSFFDSAIVRNPPAPRPQSGR